MGKFWIAAALAGVALAGCEGNPTDAQTDATAEAPATATPLPAAIEDPDAAKPLASFEGMDADGNGQISSGEHAKATQAMFQMMDADKDGAVTLAEMDAARSAIGGSAALSSEKKIATVDADSDGKLTLVEHVAGANAMFARMDANADDRLVRAEWDTGHATPAPAPGAAR